MFEDFLNHKCNIYHLEVKAVNIGYGIESPSMKYAEKEPSEVNVPCHFHIKSNSLRIVQGEPYTSLNGDVKLSLPIGTSIRENDTVEDCRNGIKYRASIPKEIHSGHHLTVTLFREDGKESAI